MSKKKELTKNTAILTIGKVCTQLVNFLLLPLYTAKLNAKEYGIVDLLLSYSMLLQPIINWQFDNGLFRFLIDVRDDIEGKKKIFSTIFFTSFFQCLLFSGLFFFLSGFISTQYKVFLLIDAIANVFLNLLLQLSRGLGENIRYTFGSFLSASFSVGLNVILIAFLDMRAFGMLTATVVAKIIAIVYLFITNKIWKYTAAVCFDMEQLKKICSYSIPLIPNQLSWWILNTSDRTIITCFISLSAVGVYAVANKISSAYSTISGIVYLAFSEAVAIHINDDDSVDFINETINSLFKLFSSFALVLISSIPLVFNVFINYNFAEAYYHIPILMLGAFFQSLVGFYSAIYVAFKKSVEIAKSTVLSAFINVVIDLLMIGKFGLYAGSVSTLIAFLFVAIYRGVSIKKYIEIHVKRYNVLVFLVSLAVVLPIYYIKNIYICICGLFFSIVISLWINRNFVLFSINIVRSRLRQYSARE